MNDARRHQDARASSVTKRATHAAAGASKTCEAARVSLDEVDPFALVGWREAAATAAADHARPGQLHAAVRARSQHGAALERAHCLATQQARQLDPFRAPDARTPFDKFGRHCSSPYRPRRGPAIRHLPTVPRTLVPVAPGNSLPNAAVNACWVRLCQPDASGAAAAGSRSKGRRNTSS
jgi:hypothetical protein